MSLAFIVLVADARADRAERTQSATTTADVQTSDLVVTSRFLWHHVVAMLTVGDRSEAGHEIAARVLRLTAVAAFPGVPLPDFGQVAIPIIRTRPVVESVLTSQFGWRRDPINGRSKLHAGMDFSAEQGTPVRAAGDGVVIKSERMGGYGRIVIIDHGSGFLTRYAHLTTILVKDGERVPAGTRIGTVGSSGRATGPHLHFEVRVLGQPVDPAPILGIRSRRFGERLFDLLTIPAGTPKSKKSRTLRSQRTRS